jgi:TRAP-type C4-dicarboxylate transport system substrate-binding protein
VDLDWWNRLPDVDRAILRESFPSIEESRRLTRRQDLADLQDPALSIVVHDLDETQRADWRAGTAAVREELLDAIGGRAREIYDVIVAGKAEFANAQP